MQGIHYVTDEFGKKIAVQLDLETYGELWEDIYDGLTADARANDPRVPLSAVKDSLRRHYHNR